MKHTEPDGEVWYGVHENYYKSGGYTVEPVRIMGEDIEDIKWVLETVLKDIEKHGVKDYD
tara:strand:- start:208 stop:387 length:180 start_codon:yes stop_codon:yes gene_type:complete